VVGGGDPCAASGVEFSIQEMDSTYTTNVQCWWPNTNVGSCGAGTYGSIASFISNGYTAAPGLRLYNFLVQNPSPALTPPTGAGPPVVLAPRYFKITMEEPPNASNTLQGEAATFPFVWHVDS
jgi:hypothetical protein